MDQVDNMLALEQPYLDSYLRQIPPEILRDMVMENLNLDDTLYLCETSHYFSVYICENMDWKRFLIEESKRITQKDIDSFFARPDWIINYYYEIGFPEQIMNHLLKDELPSDVLNKLRKLDSNTWQKANSDTIPYYFLPIGLTPRMYKVLKPYINDIFKKYRGNYYVIPLNSTAVNVVFKQTKSGIVPVLSYWL
jgi:hypothetical protein